MKLVEARKAARAMSKTATPGRTIEIVAAAMMILFNHRPTNYADFRDAERDWDRLADRLLMYPKENQ